jgi:hypothetical protein
MGTFQRLAIYLSFFSAIHLTGTAAPDDFWDGGFALQGLDGPVTAIGVQGTNVYVGGRFQYAGNVLCNGIARWDGNAWHALETGLANSGGGVGQAETILVTSNYIYVGGTFDTAGSLGNANNLARWNGTAWLPVQANGTNGVNFTCRSLAITTNGQLYAGGDFTRAGGVLVKHVARWNGTNWFALGVASTIPSTHWRSTATKTSTPGARSTAPPISTPNSTASANGTVPPGRPSAAWTLPSSPSRA